MNTLMTLERLAVFSPLSPLREHEHTNDLGEAGCVFTFVTFERAWKQEVATIPGDTKISAQT